MTGSATQRRNLRQHARQGPEGRLPNVSPAWEGWDINSMNPSAVGAAPLSSKHMRGIVGDARLFLHACRPGIPIAVRGANGGPCYRNARIVPRSSQLWLQQEHVTVQRRGSNELI